LCYMSFPSHPPWFDHSNYTWRSVQVMKLLIMQFSWVDVPELGNSTVFSVLESELLM
jgi:hypothetical protein